MKLFMSVLFFVFLGQSAFASGFVCKASENGNNYEIIACLPGGNEKGICSPIVILKDNHVVASIPKKQMIGFWLDAKAFFIEASDAGYDRSMIRLAYFGEKNSSNQLTLNLDGKALVFRDLSCKFE